MGFREWEGQMMVEECIEHLTYLREDITSVFASLIAGVSQDIQLDVEQLLKLQTQTCTLHLLGSLGVMDLS